jgi:hypothetical protein
MLTSPRLRRSLAVTAASLFGCGGGESTGPSSIEVTVSSAAVSVAQGSSTTLTITVGRTNFTGDVALSVENAGAGVTTSLTAATLPEGETQSTLTLAVGASAAAGTASLIVRAHGASVSDKTASVALTVTQAPAYTLTVPAALQLEPGQSGSLNVALSRTNFAGAVSLAVEGVPSGASAAFAPNPATADASALTISTGTAAAGTYTLTVRGTAAGLADRTGTVALTIATPSYTLTLGGATVALPQGQGTTVNVTLARTNFGGAVAFTLSGVPSGATATVSPASTNGSGAVISLNAGTAAVGTYTITVTGTASGLADRTATIALTVSAAPAGTNIVYHLCTTPIWVGYQSGTGAWTALPVAADRTYSFTVAGIGAIAYVLANGGNGGQSGYSIGVIYGSAADLQALGGGTCAAGTKSVTGTVSGVPTGESASISLGAASTSEVVGPFTLTGVADGPHDLVATRDFVNISDQGASKLIIRRALDPANGAALPGLDFNAAESLTPVLATLTVTNVSSEQTFAFADFLTANGSSGALSGTFVTGGQAPYRGVPQASLIAGDLHSLLTYGSTSTALHGIQAYFSTAIDRTLALPPAMATPTVFALATTPYARFRTQVASQSEYGVLLFSEYSQGDADAPAPTNRFVDVIATAGYFNGLPPAWVADVPDLSAAAGFNSAWGLVAGATTGFYVEVDGGSPLSAPQADGVTATFAARAVAGVSASGASVMSASRAARRSGLELPLRRLTLPRVHGMVTRR